MKVKLTPVNAKGGPAPVGPYSDAVRCGNMIFTSGQIPIDPRSGTLVQEIRAASRQVLRNLLCVVESAGGCKESIAKVVVYLRSLNDFPVFNEEYRAFFGDHRPARVLIQAGDLAEGAMLEAAVIAYVSE